MKSFLTISQNHYKKPTPEKEQLYTTYTNIAEQRGKDIPEIENLEQIQQLSGKGRCSYEQYLQNIIFSVFTSFLVNEQETAPDHISEERQTQYEAAGLYHIDLDFYTNIGTGIHEACTVISRMIDQYTRQYTKKYGTPPTPDQVIAGIQPMLKDIGSINGGLFGQISKVFDMSDMHEMEQVLYLDTNNTLIFHDAFFDYIESIIPYTADDFVAKNTSTTGCPFMKATGFARSVLQLLKKTL